MNVWFISSFDCSLFEFDTSIRFIQSNVLQLWAISTSCIFNIRERIVAISLSYFQQSFWATRLRSVLVFIVDVMVKCLKGFELQTIGE